MKILYLLLFLSLTGITCAQTHQPLFDLSFRDTTVINRVFYTDSILDSSGVWQIDSTNKPFFDSAYGIVTYADTDLIQNTKASFVVTLPQYQQFVGSLLIITHKYDFDSAHSGGYIEFSVDTGKHWHSVLNENISIVNLFPYICSSGNSEVIDSQDVYPPIWYNDKPTNTLPGGQLYLTGTDSTWRTDTIVMQNPPIDKTNHLTNNMFRFTVFSDTIARLTAGWMISDIQFFPNILFCPGGINEINSYHLKVYPNPATDVFEVSLLNETPGDYVATLYDLAGRALIRQPFTGQQTTIQRSGLDAGTYLIKVTDTGNQNTFEKIIVFD